MNDATGDVDAVCWTLNLHTPHWSVKHYWLPVVAMITDGSLSSHWGGNLSHTHTHTHTNTRPWAPEYAH